MHWKSLKEGRPDGNRPEKNKLVILCKLNTEGVKVGWFDGSKWMEVTPGSDNQIKESDSPITHWKSLPPSKGCDWPAQCIEDALASMTEADRKTLLSRFNNDDGSAKK